MRTSHSSALGFDVYIYILIASMIICLLVGVATCHLEASVRGIMAGLGTGIVQSSVARSIVRGRQGWYRRTLDHLNAWPIQLPADVKEVVISCREAPQGGYSGAL